MADAATTTHIIILPTPGMGHLIPFIQFTNKLLHHHRPHFSATFLIPNLSAAPLSAAQQSILSTLPSAVDYLLLPPPTSSSSPSPPAGAKIETLISLTVAQSLPSIRDAVKTLIDGGKKITAFVVDLFGTDGFEVASEFNIPPYIFYPSSAMALSLFLHLPKLDETVSSEYREVEQKIQIPGCMPIHGKELLDPVQDRENDAYKWVLHHCKRYRIAEGIIVNSFKELEPGPVQALQAKENGYPVVYPVGPLIRTGSRKPDEDNSECLRWLDEQPGNSVLYVSFGSGGTLSHAQIIELALGLEMSGHKFLWVTRCPNDKSLNATYFDLKNSDDPLAYLPEGFLDRIGACGMVVPMWAPQAQILAHKSTGAFLSHCGWNSTLESVVNGVPLIAWPLYAEQRMNAVMLHEDVRVALRPKIGENGLVERLEIANVVKCLMGGGEEGEGVRSRMRDLMNAAENVLGENGSSTNYLGELANKWNSATFV